MVPGKGLRIESVHPDDEGTYVCEASNVMGRISAEATLRVRERPVISVRPQARLRRPLGSAVEDTPDPCRPRGKNQSMPSTTTATNMETHLRK